MLLSMAMTRGRFQADEPNQGGWNRRPALASLSDQRVDELLKKLGGRGAVPWATSGAGSHRRHRGDASHVGVSGGSPFSTITPRPDLVRHDWDPCPSASPHVTRWRAGTAFELTHERKIVPDVRERLGIVRVRLIASCASLNLSFSPRKICTIASQQRA